MTSTSIYSASINDSILTQYKLCNKCNTSKPLTSFSKDTRRKDGYQTKCKSCDKEYAQSNKDLTRVKRQEYYQINKEILKACNKAYKQANTGKDAAKSAKRRATRISATPKWCETDIITQLYDECKALSDSTGILHHVDHIVPLQSDTVQGLHCIANLRIITASENLSKSNSYWPDMP